MSKLLAKKKNAGFTLFEIAIVVLIVAMTLTMGLSALNAYLAKASITLTQQRQLAIKDALLGFLIQSKRLPCPDANFDGIESALDRNATGKQCLNLWGPIPFLSLGLSKETVSDGWANPFDYYVSPNWTFDFDGVTFNLNTNTNAPGLIPVNTRITAPGVTFPLANPTAAPFNGAVVVIVSHGPNGTGAFSIQQNARVALPVDADELVNAPAAQIAAVPILVANGTPPPTYVISGAPALITRDTNTSTDPVTNLGGIFDDILLVLRREDFTVSLTKSGITQPIESQLAAAFQQAQTELIGYVRANVTPNLNPCTIVAPATTCTPLPNIYYLPPTTCTGVNCYPTFPSAVDPCSNTSPPARIGYMIVYDINTSYAANNNFACGGPNLFSTGVTSTNHIYLSGDTNQDPTAKVLSPGIAIPVSSPTTYSTASSPVAPPTPYLTNPINNSPCAGNFSLGGGGVVFISACNGTTFSTPLPKAYLGGF